MRINWVVNEQYQLDPLVDINQIKNIAPIWGSWKTWRGCSTDNVVCHDFEKAKELINRAFQSVCNFYVPKNLYQELGRPLGVKLYDGEYTQEVDHLNDIISLNLASTVSDIVLLLGFNLGPIKLPDDRYDKHKLVNYHGLIHSIIAGNPDIQWVLVDHEPNLDKAYRKLSNLTCDSMQNVLQLLV